jgi:hypothetical protein
VKQQSQHEHDNQHAEYSNNNQPHKRTMIASDSNNNQPVKEERKKRLRQQTQATTIAKGFSINQNRQIKNKQAKLYVEGNWGKATTIR